MTQNLINFPKNGTIMIGRCACCGGTTYSAQNMTQPDKCFDCLLVEIKNKDEELTEEETKENLYFHLSRLKTGT